MNQKDLSPIALALGITGALACSSAVAADNPFSLTELSTSHMMAGEHGGEGNCGEGKCGEGKCGEDAEDGAEGEAPAEGEEAAEGEGEGEASEGEAAEEASE